MEKAGHRISICMGSSCFSRGNALNVEIIERFMNSEGLGASLTMDAELSGTLCEGLCKEGPNLRIGDKAYRGVDPAAVEDILEYEFGGR